MDNAYDWFDMEPHVVRHDSGCWSWDGFPLDGNIYRAVAEACGCPLPAGEKLFRMPDCALGKDCINPMHLGTSVDFVLALNGRRQEIPEPPTTVSGGAAHKAGQAVSEEPQNSLGLRCPRRFSLVTTGDSSSLRLGACEISF